MFRNTFTLRSALTAIALSASLFSFAQAATNIAPTISGTPQTTTTANYAYSFQPTAYDANGDSLKFSVSNKPTWASFNTSTGRLYGTPKTSGRFASIAIKVSDGKTTKSLASFSITVNWNKAPTISGSPRTSVLAGQAYAFRPTASDPDALPKALSFSIANKPAWASFSTSTGNLCGTPKAGKYLNVSIKVTDGSKTATLPAFTITVNAQVVSNHAPTITGTPVTAGTVGQPYAFRPAAADVDGDAMTFSIANKPDWASFDTSNGTLYGTPPAASSNSNVTISVSDSAATSSLAPFSISILPAPTSQVNLRWTPPVQNTDGTPISDLAGYRVSYGNASHGYSVELDVSGAAMNGIVIESLQPGTYYFAVKAVTSYGVVSDFSNEVSKVF